MYPEMDYYYGDSFIIQPFLEDFDTESFENALNLIIDGQSNPLPELIQIKHALKSYFEECNNVFLASESIRHFLLIGILMSLLVSIILLASTPVSILTISLICFESLILFSVNFFTLYKQMEGYEQKFAKDTLQKCNSDYQKKLNSKFFILNLTNLRGQISSPTSTPCLFPARKIPQNAEFTQNTGENSLNNDENHLSPIDENSYESLIESNDSSHLLSNTL
ncbi:MAG TPA: hypothetical protein VGH95_00875 [Candidatus Aquirickettsiella sp.]|jgi:hypothetical protein